MPVTTCVFDAYGTLFDVSSAARDAAREPGREPLAALWPTLAGEWRRKQLEYTWLRAVQGLHADFWQVTKDALDWTLEAQNLPDPALRERLLALYWELAPYPEVPRMLAAMKARGMATAILSNGSPEMLEAAVTSAEIGGDLDALLSVEGAGVFKPAQAVYDLVGQRFGTAAGEVLFVSANGWDAAAGAAYGFRSAWVNRAGDPAERLPGTPEFILSDLTDLPALELS